MPSIDMRLVKLKAVQIACANAGAQEHLDKIEKLPGHLDSSSVGPLIKLACRCIEQQKLKLKKVTADQFSEAWSCSNLSVAEVSRCQDFKNA